jgi:hypothetical protein
MKIRDLLKKRTDFVKKTIGTKVLDAYDNDDLAIRGFSLDDLVELFSDIDPSPNKQYIQWIANQYSKKHIRIEDLDNVQNTLQQFEKVKKQLTNKDIGHYKHIADLENAIEKLLPKPSKRSEVRDIKEKETRKVYNGPDGIIIIPLTHRASTYYGSGTRWCTTGRNSGTFDSYNRQGPLFIFLAHDGRKYQFHIESRQFKNERDIDIHMDVVEKRYPHAIKFFYNKYLRPAFAKSPQLVSSYALNNLKDRSEEFEEYIISHGTSMGISDYAVNKIKGRWVEAEDKILRNPDAAIKYARAKFKDGRWKELEDKIVNIPEAAYEYARMVIKGRWPAAEDAIYSSDTIGVNYAKMLGKPSKKLENKIYNIPISAFKYAKEVLNGRFQMAEPYIRASAYWPQYSMTFGVKNVKAADVSQLKPSDGKAANQYSTRNYWNY